jgi:hypothetical protein
MKCNSVVILYDDDGVEQPLLQSVAAKYYVSDGVSCYNTLILIDNAIIRDDELVEIGNGSVLGVGCLTIITGRYGVTDKG